MALVAHQRNHHSTRARCPQLLLDGALQSHQNDCRLPSYKARLLQSSKLSLATRPRTATELHQTPQTRSSKVLLVRRRSFLRSSRLICRQLTRLYIDAQCDQSLRLPHPLHGRHRQPTTRSITLQTTRKERPTPPYARGSSLCQLATCPPRPPHRINSPRPNQLHPLAPRYR